MKDKLLFDVLDGEINRWRRELHQNEVSLSRYKLDFDKYGDHIKICDRNNYKIIGKIEGLEDLRTALVGKGFFKDDRTDTENE